MIVGGYSLHLYCDGPDHRALHPTKFQSLDAEFEGRDEADCNRQAKRAGWRLRNGVALCQKCIKHKITKDAEARALKK